MERLTVTFALVVLLLGCARSMTSQEMSIICSTVCHHVHQYDQATLTYCGCQVHGHKTRTTEAPMATHAHTDDVCDYLCSIQMGGSACDCSIPIVPGRKRLQQHAPV